VQIDQVLGLNSKERQTKTDSTLRGVMTYHFRLGSRLTVFAARRCYALVVVFLLSAPYRSYSGIFNSLLSRNNKSMNLFLVLEEYRPRLIFDGNGQAVLHQFLTCKYFFA
jgi:hypothetical protein